ncbi:expressed unknown protein [Seminavis robusta]|uniref:Fe2OG dioxygenase domain-containing protein n=1 Tax=Seminavis robusta TaxID=568900 RepID=A0A9N8HN52_9STRA|nr:expressed unknown protein [Seminavis robusta]|eukprot:Sro958_g224700.1 n/a (292) ;mRNA; r:35605-36480
MLVAQALSTVFLLLSLIVFAQPADDHDFSRISVEVTEIPAPDASTTCSDLSLGERIEKGEIIVQLSNALEISEVDYLVESALKAADEQEEEGLTCPGDGGFQGRARMPTLRAAQREKCLHNALPKALSDKMEQALVRILAYIDLHLPSIATTLLHTEGPPARSAVDLFLKDLLDYNKREPAINVYTSGGHFGIHADLKALTLLFPLSTSGVDFEGGGGTAFWPPVSLEKAKETDPTLVLVPPPGSVLLFGGVVPHKGLAIEKGTRLVFVASFLRKPRLRRWPNGTYTRTYN